MTWRLLLPLLLLAACGGPSVATIDRSCDTAARPFVESWPCVRAAYLSSRPSDLDRYVVATGDVAAERVRGRQMTDAEARMVIAKAQSEARSALFSRYAAIDGGGPTTYQRVGPGTVIAY